MMDIVIKEIETAEETRGKAFVYWSAWHDTYPGLVSQEYLDGLTLEKCEKTAFDCPDKLLVAKDRGRVVGFISYSDQSRELPDAGEILALYVLREYRGKGIGHRLLEAALAELVPCGRVCLWALRENRRAISFYQKWGFQLDGAEKFSRTVSAAGVRMTLVRSLRPTPAEQDSEGA